MLSWETTPGYSIHLLNYTNPNTHHGWLQAAYPLGPQTIRMKLPQGVNVRSVELLRAGQRVPFAQNNQMLQLTIPRIEDYEVAAITVT